MRFSAWFFGSLRRNFLDAGVLGLGRAARRRALHRPRFDDAVRVDLEEQFRRARQHDRIAQRNQRAVFDRLARGQRGEGRERIAVHPACDRKGQVDLIAVAFAQMPVNAPESLARSRRTTMPAGHRRSGRWRAAPRFAAATAVRRAVEHAEAHERRPAAFGEQRLELRLEQIAGFIGEIAGQPFAAAARRFGLVERGSEVRASCASISADGASNSSSPPARSSRKSTKGDAVAHGCMLNGRATLHQRACRPLQSRHGRRERQLLAYSSASSSSISPPITPSPICQKAGSDASSPNGASSSEWCLVPPAFSISKYFS